VLAGALKMEIKAILGLILADSRSDAAGAERFGDDAFANALSRASICPEPVAMDGQRSNDVGAEAGIDG
jgi:hypothetical protein